MELRQIDPLQQNVFCTITFHYVPKRLPVLTKVLHSLASFMCKRIDVVIVINNEAKDLSNYLKLISKEFSGDRFYCRIHVSNPLPHPHHLPWVNQKLHADAFALENPFYDVFISLEDDINFTWTNFSYWCTFLPRLKQHGLIPGFFRVEQNQDGQWRLTDNHTGSMDLLSRKKLDLSDRIFVNPGNGLQAFWILDRELMYEYINSPSFDIEKSTNVRGWAVRARAAMGLLFENVPEGFTYRSVIPLDCNSKRFDWCASVHHIPNNYALGKSKFGKVPVSEYFEWNNSLVETISVYQNALQVPQSPPWVYERLGDLLRQNNQSDKAIPIYKKVVSLEKNNYYCYLNLARACISQKRIDEGIAYYKKCLILQPNAIELKNDLANLEKELGKKIKLDLPKRRVGFKHRLKGWLKKISSNF